MQRWTRSTGYPILSVEEVLGAPSGYRRFKVTQSRFGAVPKGESTKAGVWQVPVQILTEAGHRATTLLTETTALVDVQATATHWVSFNAHQSGFYRLSYTGELLVNLARGVRESTLPAADCLGLLSDTRAIASRGDAAGNTSLAPTLLLLNQFDSAIVIGVDLAVLQELCLNLRTLLIDVSDLADDEPELVQRVRELAIRVVSPVATLLGWTAVKGEASTDMVKRSTVLSTLALAKHEPTLEEAQRRFTKERASIPADLLGMVYKIYVKHHPDGEAAYEQMLKLYRGTDLAVEKRRCVLALCKAKTKALQLRTLDWALNSGEVRTQDFGTVLSALSGTCGPTLTWNWFEKNFQKVQDRFTKGLSFVIGSIASAVVGAQKTEADAKKVEEFFKINPIPSAHRAIGQSLEKVRSHARGRARLQAALRVALMSSEVV